MRISSLITSLTDINLNNTNNSSIQYLAKRISVNREDTISICFIILFHLLIVYFLYDVIIIIIRPFGSISIHIPIYTFFKANIIYLYSVSMVI